MWGDHLEIQAMSEIYNRPIEVYAMSDSPMKTFHENGDSTPLRLSFHGSSHYNSIVPMSWNHKSSLSSTEPGIIEDEAISMSKQEDSKFEPVQSKENIQLYRKIIEQSRMEFKKQD